MDLKKAAAERHSVRQYKDIPIEKETAEELRRIIAEENKKSALNFQLICDEPGGFSGFMAKYGSFRNVKNYIVAAGPAGKDLEIGYYGEKIVVAAQALGLNTCWVALTYNKRKTVFSLRENDKFYLVISVGYGENAGHPHKSKEAEAVSNVTDISPEWFIAGVEAALLAPTAVNQQRFFFTLDGDTVKGEAPAGKYTKMDLGIAMYHFDLGSGRNNFGME